MKNKKVHKIPTPVIIFIIFGISALITFILAILFIFPKSPHYKIYENVCHNETQEWFVYQDGAIAILYNNSVDAVTIGNMTYWKTNENVSVCQQQEVNSFPKCNGTYLCKDNPECCLNYYFQNDTQHIQTELNSDCSQINSSAWTCGNYTILESNLSNKILNWVNGGIKQ